MITINKQCKQCENMSHHDFKRCDNRFSYIHQDIDYLKRRIRVLEAINRKNFEREAVEKGLKPVNLEAVRTQRCKSGTPKVSAPFECLNCDYQGVVDKPCGAFCHLCSYSGFTNTCPNCPYMTAFIHGSTIPKESKLFFFNSEFFKVVPQGIFLSDKNRVTFDTDLNRFKDKHE